MTTRNPMPRRQRGAALLMLLVAILMAGSYLVYRGSNLGFTPYRQSTQLAATLARAKEALIARAVTDANRPGSLPCPDLITDNAGLSNYPGDGKADMFTLTQCPSYVGWLPWVTLDLPELTDDTGSRLWYVLAPPLRDDDSAQPINSDTTTALRLDGNTNIAALIIAPHGAIAAQNRPSNNPADYLDGENGNGDDDTYISGPTGDTFNDVVAVITRQELMAAVEKRVANEVKSCLEQHAAAAANSEHRYPWPAPFSAGNLHGRAGSHFGQVPDSQPGSGPEPMLQQSIADLGDARRTLGSASDAGQQLTIVLSLSESLSVARNLFDTLYIASTKLWQASQRNAPNLASLTAELTRDLRPNRAGNASIINSEQSRIRSRASATYDLIELLPVALAESGLDPFPELLQQHTSTFANQPTPLHAQAIVELLSRSTAAHVDIAPSLSAALAAALNALSATQAAAADPDDAALAATASSTGTALVDASAALQRTIEHSRINTHYSEISPAASQLASLNAKLAATPSANNAAVLAARLDETKALIDRIATGTSAIVAARNNGSQALETARQAALAASEFPLIGASTTEAINRITTLVNAMRDNDDNLTRSSLAAATADFIAAQSAFATMNIANTRSRVPYAQALQSATVDVDFWAKIITAESYDLASRAKAIPVAVDTDFASVVAIDGSAYQTANSALSSSQATSSALQAYLDSPTPTRQTAASAALAETTGQLDNLLGQAGAIDSALSGSAGSAFPIVWLSSRCDFLRPSVASWWLANQWSTSLFYQIGNVLATAPGTLKVNGAGAYRLVAIAAGPAVSIVTAGPPRTVVVQNRAIRSAANFFEGRNADPSRDGDASAPSADFESRPPVVDTASSPPVTTFNDRLAY